MADVSTPEPFGGSDPVVEIDVRSFLADDHADAASPGATADLAELERIELELTEVEAALARLDDGTYGACQVCHSPIADELLAGEPLARTCALH